MPALLHVLGQLFLFAVLVIAAGAVLRHMAAAAFRPGGSPARPARGGSAKALRSPAPRAVRTAGRSAVAAAARPGNSQIRTQARADARRAWTEVKAADWLEQRRHERQNGAAAAVAPRLTLRQRLRLAPAASGTTGGSGASPNGGGQANGGNGSTPTPATVPPPPNGTQGPAPPPQAPARPAQPASTNGGTNVAPSTAGAEQLIEGVNRIHAEAAAGGIHHKQAAIKAATEGCIRFAGMAQMLARTMSEPGSNYGPEITEPLAKAAQHLQAAAMSFGESDTNVTTLIHMSVGELASSPRQAPHHSELSESGAR